MGAIASVAQTSHENAAVSRSSLAQLRALLLAPNEQRLTSLELALKKTNQSMRCPQRMLEDHSNVLAQAIVHKQQQGSELAEALQPVLVDGFHQSIRDDPNVLAESLYPVLGPAVRKLVANLFTPDHANSGKPYSIEQLYVIHRETSLLINQTLIEATEAQDGDMVSGMLDAIRSFVRDAFEAHEFDGLDTLKVGDLTVWVEWGPEAIMAVVVRGMAPTTLRPVFARGLEMIHQDFAQPLLDFNGDSSPFESLSSILEIMVQGTRVEQIRAQLIQWRTPALAVSAVLAVIAASTYWLYTGQQWMQVIDQLNAQDGIVVVSSERGFREYHLTAMRDPLATDPQQALNQIAQLSEFDIGRISARWYNYQSLDDSIVVSRARQLLNPPASIDLTVRGDTLHATGKAPQNWISETLHSLPIIRSLLGKELVLELVFDSDTNSKSVSTKE